MTWTPRRKITVSPVGVITQNLHGYVGFLALAKELIQNADDAGVHSAASRGGQFGASTVRFRFFGDRVEVENNGPLFDENDIDAIAQINFGHKQRTSDAAGYFGAGFGAVYAITDVPEIHSNGRRFRMNWATEEGTQEEDADTTGDPQWTKIVLPFRRTRTSILARNSPQAVAVDPWDVRQFARDLRTHLGDLLLFLRNVRTIELYGASISTHPSYVASRDADGVKLSAWDPQKHRVDVEKIQRWYRAAGTFVPGPQSEHISRSCQVELAVAISSSPPPGLLYSVLPLDLSLGFRMMLNGHFIPDPTRKHIVEHGAGAGAWNHEVVTALEKLIIGHIEPLRDALVEGLRDAGQAASVLYAALPLDKTSVLPLFRDTGQAVRRALSGMRVIPNRMGVWHFPKDMYWLDPQQAERKIAERCQHLPVVHPGLTNRALADVFTVLGVTKLTRQILLSHLKMELTPGLQALDGKHPLVGERDRLEDLLRYVLSRENQSDDWTLVNTLPCVPNRQGRLTSPMALIVPSDEDMPAVNVLLKLRRGDLPLPDERFRGILESRRGVLMLSGLTIPKVLSYLRGALPAEPTKPEDVSWTLADLRILYDHLRRAWMSNQTLYRTQLHDLQAIPMWLTEDGWLRAATSDRPLHVKSSEALPKFLSVTDVIDTRLSEGELRTFLRSGVGFEELGPVAFIRDHLLRRWSEVPDRMRYQALEFLRETLLATPPQSSLVELLRQTQLVPTPQREWRRASEVFLPSPWMADLLGPLAPTIDPKVSPKIPSEQRYVAHERLPEPVRWNRLWELLGVQRYPPARHLVASVQDLLTVSEPARRGRLRTFLVGLDRMLVDVRSSENRAEITQALMTGLAPLQKVPWIPAEGRADLLRPTDVAPSTDYFHEIAGSTLTFADVSLSAGSILPELLGFRTEPTVEEVLAHLEALASRGTAPSGRVYDWLAEHRHYLPKKKIFSDRPLIYQHDRFYRPRDLFLVETKDFGEYRLVVPENTPSHLRDLYQALGARSTIDHTDYIAVLEEIAAKSAREHVEPGSSDEEVIRSAYRWLAGAAARQKLPSRTEFQRRLILTQDGRLDHPSVTFWVDNPHWAALAKVASPQFCRLDEATFLPWYGAAGVRRLSNAIHRELDDVIDQRPDPQLAALLRARWPFLERIILHFEGMAEACESWVLQVDTFRATRLQTKGTLAGLGTFTSTEELAWVELDGNPPRLIVTPGYEGLVAAGQGIGEVLLTKAGLDASIERSLFIQYVTRVVEAPEKAALDRVLDVAGVRRGTATTRNTPPETRYLEIPVVIAKDVPGATMDPALGETLPSTDTIARHPTLGPSPVLDGEHRSEAEVKERPTAAGRRGETGRREESPMTNAQTADAPAPPVPKQSDGVLAPPPLPPASVLPSEQPRVVSRPTVGGPPRVKRQWLGASVPYDGEIRLRAPRGTNDVLRARGYNLEHDRAEIEKKIEAVEANQHAKGTVTIVLRAEALYLGVIELPEAAEGLFPIEQSEFRLTSLTDRSGISIRLDRKRRVLFNRERLPDFLWAHLWSPGTVLILSRTGSVDEYELRDVPGDCTFRKVISFVRDERGEPKQRVDPEVHFNVRVNEDVYRSARRWEDFELMAQLVDRGVIATIAGVLERHAARGEPVVDELTLRDEVFAQRRCSYASVAIALRQHPRVFEQVGSRGWRLLPPPQPSKTSPGSGLERPPDDNEPMVPWLTAAWNRINAWAGRADARLVLPALRPIYHKFDRLLRRLEESIAESQTAKTPPDPDQATADTDAFTALTEGLKALKKIKGDDPTGIAVVLRRVASAVAGLGNPATAAVLYLLIARMEATTLRNTSEAIASLQLAAQFLLDASLRSAAAAVNAVAQDVAKGMPWPGIDRRLGTNGQQVREQGCRGAWWLAVYSAQRRLFDTQLAGALTVVDP